MGQGPALYTSCNLNISCNIKVGDETKFNGNQIINASTGESLPAEDSPSVYAVGEAPIISAFFTGQIVEKYTPPLVAGTEIYLIGKDETATLEE